MTIHPVGYKGVNNKVGEITNARNRPSNGLRLECDK
jgi:hypothetical protein